MIRINLLPHREIRRERRRKEFTVIMGLAAAAGVALVVMGGMVINMEVEGQVARNSALQQANAALDTEIKEIASIDGEIAALKARQKAVEDLQSNRTLPVHMFDELVRMMPEGTFLKELKQEDLKVSMSGYAQSNDRVAELLRNLSEKSAWLEKPQLDEIKEVAMPGVRAAQALPDSRKVYEFALNVLLRRGGDRPAAPGDANPAKSAAMQAPVVAASLRGDAQ